MSENLLMPRRPSRPSLVPGISPKKIHKNSLLGQQGVNLIERIVLNMGCIWHPRGAIDAGIDGEIELRDAVTGDVQNFVIHVQSKATNTFTAETPSSFEYLCDERDLSYWLYGNAPVILIVSRPATDEAYWVSIKDYFQDLSRLRSRKVIFDKQRDRFDSSCREALFRIAAPRDKGVYLSPPPQTETLYTNLLQVTSFAPQIFIAETSYRTPKAIYDVFRKTASGSRWPSEWILKSGSIISFCDLDDPLLQTICDVGTIETFDADEWAWSDDEERVHDFIYLLNQALQGMLSPMIRFDPKMDYYYFSATKDLTPRILEYQSLKSKTTRTVFKGYSTQKNPSKISYYRHSAFKGRFVRFEDVWYLEITPTYHYTRDGKEYDQFYEQRIKRIKMLERNQAVLGQVMMWRSYLQRSEDMFRAAYPYLQFGDLQSFTVDLGIDDKNWLQSEDQEEAKHIGDNPDQLHLFDA